MDNLKATIKNFSGMGDNGVYYLENMATQKINGYSILTPGWYTSDYINENDTRFSGLSGVINGFAGIQYSSSITDQIIGISNSKIFSFDYLTNTGDSCGLIHTIASTGSGVNQIISSQNPDIFNSKENNIFYSSSNHLGAGWVFTVTSATSTSITISGKTLYATYKIDDATGTNKIYNITKREEYTNTTNEPTDTLNFTTASTTPEAGDIVVCFVDNRFKFETSYAYNQHFGGQSITSNWVRQIKLLGSDYWILNGNYVASLNVDEATFAEDAKQLPYRTQATCFDINDELMLVGGNYFGVGKLCLWDGYSAGWLNVKELDSVPVAIKSYRSGWIVITQNRIYYTDGYQIDEITNFVDINSYRVNINTHYNGVIVVNDDVIINCDPGRYTRAKDGLYIFNVKNNSWSYSPYSTSLSKIYNGDSGAIYNYNTGSLYTIFASGSCDNGTDNYFINRLFFGSPSKYSSIFYVMLPVKMRISKIELNLANKFNLNQMSSGTTDVTVSYGDGKNYLWGETQAGGSSTTSAIYNQLGASYPASIGQEMVVLEGDTGGETSWITDIVDGGTANEIWTISPTLSTTPENDIVLNFMNLKKSETKTITNNAISNNLTFNVSDFYSDKLLIKVRFNVNSGDSQLDLHSINIY